MIKLISPSRDSRKNQKKITVLKASRHKHKRDVGENLLLTQSKILRRDIKILRRTLAKSTIVMPCKNVQTRDRFVAIKDLTCTKATDHWKGNAARKTK